MPALRAGRYAEAAKALDAEPELLRRPDLRLARAKAASELGDAARAVELLDKLEMDLPALSIRIRRLRADAQLSAGPYAEAADRLFPKLWLPGGWAGVHGAYQSELKVIMGLLGQPTGHVRRPRLPITDPGAIADIRRVLVEEGLL